MEANNADIPPVQDWNQTTRRDEKQEEALSPKGDEDNGNDLSLPEI